MARKGGLASLLDEIGAFDAPACDSEQLALFDDVHEAAQADSLNCAARGDNGDHGADSLNRGRGRPKGALNRSTVEMRRYIANKYSVSPLEFLVGLLNTDTQTIIEETGCKVENVIKVQTSAAVAALPYLHQKMPVDVHVADTKRHLVLMEGMTSEAEELLRNEDAIIIEVDENGEEIAD